MPPLSQRRHGRRTPQRECRRADLDAFVEAWFKRASEMDA
jgi:hypothetical protein